MPHQVQTPRFTDVGEGGGEAEAWLTLLFLPFLPLSTWLIRPNA
jgi:hypothetical protein